MERLDRRIALAQRVVGGVGNLGLVLAMVEPVVPGDFGGQPLQLRRGLLLGQFVDGFVGDGHVDVPVGTDRSSASRTPCGPGITAC